MTLANPIRRSAEALTGGTKGSINPRRCRYEPAQGPMVTIIINSQITSRHQIPLRMLLRSRRAPIARRCVERSAREQPNGKDKDMKDQVITNLFRQWLTTFERTQAATGEEEAGALVALTQIETRIVATPAEGPRGLVVKLGLHCFLNEHADAASEQADSAYADLVRLTGHDPATEISSRLALVPARTN